MRSVTRFWITAALLAAIPSLGQAQANRRVTGNVTVEGTSEPIGGATIQVVGTTLGTTADQGGHFSLTVPAGPQQLRVRRIGFRATVVPVGASEEAVNIGLVRDVLQLQAQVVTGQATTISQANAANAVTVVTSDQINRVPQQTIENALQGKVPGAVITQNSGAPGGGIQVQIRGTNTINGAYQPLYVIDGVAVNNDAYGVGLNSITGAGGGITSSQDQQVNRIADLNPEDIASMQILKGPSAGAIYGSQGANGVIIITTKRGTTGKPSLNLIQRFGTQGIQNSMKLRCFSQADATAFVNDVKPAGMTADEYFAAYPYSGCTDPQQQLYGQHTLDYETSASLRGGNAGTGTTYYASGTVKHDGGLTQYDTYNKQSLRLNLNQTLGSRFAVQASSEVIHTLTQRGVSGNDNATISPFNIISATPTFYNFDQRLDNGDYAPDPWVGNQANALQNAALIKTPENVYRMIGSAQASYTMFQSARQKLSATLLGGVDQYNDHSGVYSPPNSYVEQSGFISPYPGTVVKNNADVTNANLNFSLVHRFTASAFTATTSAGLRQTRAESDFINNQGEGLFPGITNVSSAVQLASSETQSLTKTFSYYAQEEFLTLNESLALTAAVNAERSSSNGDANKFYAFPKFGASYNLPWLPPKTSSLKLRVAYGQAGNRVPVNYKYTYLSTTPLEGINGLIASSQVGLSTVRPEQTNELEGGVDATFFNGRAALEYTRYQKKTNGLVLTAGLAPSTGFTSQVINGGSLMNVGTEVGLNLIPIQSRLLTWTSNTTFARNRGEVTSLPVPAFTAGSGFSEAFGVGKVQLGYSPTQAVVYKKIDGVRTEIHPGDQTPDFQMGFTNDFTVSKFHLSTLIDWRKGGYLVNLTNLYFDGNIPGGNFADTATSNARLTGYINGQPVYLEHAGFAKLREVTLSYDLPTGLTGSLFGGKASASRLELSGRNLYTWTHYTGYDPEVSNFGNAAIGRMQDVAPYPPMRQFYVSINATF
jgi:TonB-linked SusC/RagA family outer membrane protein